MMLDSDETDIRGVAAIAPFVPDRHWWQGLFAAIDSGDPVAFVNCLTPDAEFRFANAAALVGRQAITAGVAEFFTAIASSQHRLLEFWSTHNAAGCEGEVTYTRHNGSLATFPFANVFKLRGTKICSYHIYIDNSALFINAA
jgi:ketosteroid isomerase-like protein